MMRWVCTYLAVMTMLVLVLEVLIVRDSYRILHRVRLPEGCVIEERIRLSGGSPEWLQSEECRHDRG